jgi:hypothetical protein
VPEQLDDEEWVSARAIGELLYEPCWRVRLAERGERTLYLGVRERTQDDRAGLSFGDELIERRLDSLRRENLARLTANRSSRL